MRNFLVQNGIYHHKSGNYRIRERKGRNLEICFSSRPGIWESAKTRDLYEAEEYANSILLNSGRGGYCEHMPFGKFADNFFIRADENSYRKKLEAFGKEFDDKYFRAMQGRLDNYIMPRFKDVPINMITTLEVENMYSRLVSCFNGKPLSGDSKNKVRECMSIIMQDAFVKKLIDRNPCEGSMRVKEHRKSRDILTLEELSLLFPEDKSKLFSIWFNEKCQFSEGAPLMWATYFSIMMDTGFRPGEIAGLSKSSFRNGGVYTMESVNSATKTLKKSIKTTDSGQPYKVGILSDYTQTLLDQLMENTPGEFLFQINGRFFCTNTSNKHFKAACKRAGIELGDRTQYCLRHSFDTYMLNSIGDDLKQKEVQELMGHTSHRKEYDHRTADDRIRKLSKVKNIIDDMRVQA